MGLKKRVLAAILASAMVLSTAVTAFAAGSPANADYNTETKADENTQDHTGNEVVTKVTKKAATVVKVTGDGENAEDVVLKIARDKNNKKKAITVIGDGKKGVFDSKAGRKVKTVRVKSSKKVTVKAKAFKGSKVKKLLSTSKIKFNKNAFKGTKVKALRITVYAKKASRISFVKGSFTGLSNKAKFVVKGMSKTEFKKLKKALKAAGFKGKIARL